MDYTRLGFHRVAAVSPPLTLCDPMANARTTLTWARRAAEGGACRDRVTDEATSEVLAVILETTISPELLPPVLGEPQSTEAAIGPYVLHDFFLFHHVRNGFSPTKIYALSKLAFPDRPADDIKRWMKVFFQRFYTQQFKRTTLPAGPKVGSVTLSPRGDLRMPDEVSPLRLLDEIDTL
jgi:NAD+ synthase (glutamine-hydrolysing)